MARINPRHVQYIKDMQPDFDFHERKIQPSLDVASSEDLFKVENEADDDTESAPKSKNTTRQTEISRSLSGGHSHTSSGSSHPSQNKGRSSISPSEEIRLDHRMSSHHRSSNAANSRLTLAVPQSHTNSHTNSGNSFNLGNSTPGGGGGGGGLSNEDRRLLTRAKWLLRRLLDSDDEPYDPLHPELYTDTTTGSNKNNENTSADLDPDIKWKIENKRKKANKKYITIENTLKDILNDEIKKKETLFVLNILSFLKDGNAKCLSEIDSRSWAQELLQSVGRSTDLVSTIMGNKSTMTSTTNGLGSNGNTILSDTSGRRSSLSIDPEVDMDTWRSVLVHMRAHYPIGMAAKSAHVHYLDESDPLQTNILKRIETMKSDLMNIIELKEEKIHNSKTGKIIESTLSLKENPTTTATSTSTFSSSGIIVDGGAKDKGEGEETGAGGGEGGIRIPQLKVPAVNIYAENILNQPGKSRGGGTIFEEENDMEDEDENTKDEEENEDEDLAKYDEIQLTKDLTDQQQQSHILSLQQSLVDTLSSSGKSIEYDDEFVIDKVKKEEEDRERDRARLRERRKQQQQQNS